MRAQSALFLSRRIQSETRDRVPRSVSCMVVAPCWSRRHWRSASEVNQLWFRWSRPFYFSQLRKESRIGSDKTMQRGNSIAFYQRECLRLWLGGCDDPCELTERPKICRGIHPCAELLFFCFLPLPRSRPPLPPSLQAGRPVKPSRPAGRPVKPSRPAGRPVKTI